MLQLLDQQAVQSWDPEVGHPDLEEDALLDNQDRERKEFQEQSSLWMKVLDSLEETQEAVVWWVWAGLA